MKKSRKTRKSSAPVDMNRLKAVDRVKNLKIFRGAAHLFAGRVEGQQETESASRA